MDKTVGRLGDVFDIIHAQRFQFIARTPHLEVLGKEIEVLRGCDPDQIFFNQLFKTVPVDGFHSTVSLADGVLDETVDRTGQSARIDIIFFVPLPHPGPQQNAVKISLEFCDINMVNHPVLAHALKAETGSVRQQLLYDPDGFQRIINNAMAAGRQHQTGQDMHIIHYHHDNLVY
jgi:hypothetical protein